MRLTETNDLFDDMDFPTTSEEIIATHGKRNLSLANGNETVERVFARCGPETFDTPEDALLTLYSSVSDDAIGRKGYTDRDPPQLKEIDLISF